MELKSTLMARNLETSGRKAVLIVMLESAVTPDTETVNPVGWLVVSGGHHWCPQGSPGVGESPAAADRGHGWNRKRAMS